MAREESVKLTIKNLLEVQTGIKNIKISVLDGYNKITVDAYTHVHCQSLYRCVFRAWNSLRLRRPPRRLSGRKKLVRTEW